MSASDSKYHPEPYWSEVARRIGARDGHSIIAGDDEPYYRYKRARFLKLLHSVDFSKKNVLEVGCGPGGNLLEVLKHKPIMLTGVDISDDMIELAGMTVDNADLNGQAERVQLQKIDGTRIPYSNGHFDMVLTATVLQHNTDDAMHRNILDEICRVSGQKVVLMERIERQMKGDDLCMGRPLEQYKRICSDNGFQLESVEYINTRVSYFVSGAIRKTFNKVGKREGEANSAIANFLQRITLPVTIVLDRIFTSPTDVTKMIFTKKS